MPGPAISLLHGDVTSAGVLNTLWCIIALVSVSLCSVCFYLLISSTYSLSYCFVPPCCVKSCSDYRTVKVAALGKVGERQALLHSLGRGGATLLEEWSPRARTSPAATPMCPHHWPIPLMDRVHVPGCILGINVRGYLGELMIVNTCRATTEQFTENFL